MCVCWTMTWFFTGVTTPRSRQSIAGGGVLLVRTRPLVGWWVAEQFCRCNTIRIFVNNDITYHHQLLEIYLRCTQTGGRKFFESQIHKYVLCHWKTIMVKTVIFLAIFYSFTLVGVIFAVEPLDILEIPGEYVGACLILSLARVLLPVLKQ